MDKNLLLLLFMTCFCLPSIVLKSQAWQWQNPLPQGNSIQDVYFTDSQTGWAVGSNGTVIHTTNGGQNWTIQSSGTTEQLDGVHFTDSQTGWAVGGYGTILHTTNGGQNWIIQLSVTTDDLFDVHFTDNQNGWAVGGNCVGGCFGIILYTTNGGQNWTVQSSGTVGYLVDVHFTDSQNGWAVGGGNVGGNSVGVILHTGDGGQNWSAQSSGTPYSLSGVHFTDNQNGWAVGSGEIILHTSNGGQNWTTQSPGTLNSFSGVYFTDNQNGWAVGFDYYTTGGTGTIYYTTNGGQNWVPQSSGTIIGLADVYFTDSQNGWAVGGGGTILHTTNGGQDWTASSSAATTYTLNDIHFTDNQNGWVASSGQFTGTDGVILRTTNSGQNWSAQPLTGAGTLLSVYFNDSQHGWAVGGNPEYTIARTVNGGQNWTVQSYGTGGYLSDVHFTDSQNGWAVGTYGAIFHTTNGGQNWVAQSSGTTNDLLGIQFVDSQNGWAVGAFDTILHTTNGGQNWSAQSSGTAQGLSDVHFTDSQTGWAVGSFGMILHTTNGGQNWSAQSSGAFGPLVDIHFTDNQNGWVIGLEGVIFHTTNGGQNWTEVASGTLNSLYGIHFTDNQNGWAVGEYGTILKYSDPSIFTSSSPQLTFSTVQLNPGQILTFTGTDFTPNSTATIFISKPDGTEQEVDVPTNASGAFSYNYSASSVSGSYSVRAKDVTNGKFTVSKVFQVTGTQPPVDYLKISSPVATDVFYTGGFIKVLYSDKMFLSGSTYPIQGARRRYKYKIEYSLNNGIWQGGKEQEGEEIVNQYATLVYQLPAPPTPGTCRIRVTDLYNPIRQKISPSFVLQLPGPVTALQADFEWDYSYLPRLSTPIEGVAADGVGRFYIKVYKPGGIPIQSVSVALSDVAGSSNTSAKLGKVMKATVTNGFSPEANQASAISVNNVAPNADGNVWIWYVAPEDFARNSADYTKSEREVNIQISATFAGGATETINEKIKIVRPPVMLAHGLGGDSESWDEFELSSGTLLKDDNSRFVKLPRAVSLLPTAAFEQNAKRLTYLNEGHENSLPSVVAAMRSAGFVCNQADYVCHSMGGSVMRYCLSDKINGSPNPTFVKFFIPGNYGKGYVHKFVTLNTPHNGSPFADLLHRYQDDPILRGIAWLQGFYKNGQLEPAILNLQIDPNQEHHGGINFSSTPFGIHAHRIASNIDCEDYSDPKNGSLWFLLYNAYKLGSSPFFQLPPSCDERKEMFEDLGYDPSFFDASDFIVGTKSQLTGDGQFVTAGNKTVYDGLTHSTPFANRVLISSEAANRTLFLLNQELSSSFFAPLPATPNFSGGNENTDIALQKTNVKINYSTAQKSNGKIEITSPLLGDTLTMDEAMQLGISVLDTTGFRKVNVLFQDELYSSVTVASLLNFNVQVNGNLIEKQKILAVGYYYTPDSGAVQYVDEIEVYITTTEPIAAFEASPQVNFIEKGENFRPTYSARFSTNIGELGNSPELTATIENSAVLVYQPNNNSFTAIDTGSTYAVVTYKGLSDTLFFLVVDISDSVVVDNPGGLAASFNYQITPCVNAQASFINTTPGATSYLWEFGDGATSTLPNPTHQYAEPGAYNVILSVMNIATGQSGLVVQTVNVANSVISAAISPIGTITLCDGDTITLSANAGTGYAYQWLRNGSPVVNGTNQQYVAFQWGYFTVRVTDATGCSTVSAPTIITVTPSPTVSATLQGPAAICPGDSTLLKATSTGGISYQWLLNGTLLPGAMGISLYATVPGDYSVVTTNAFGCSKTSFPVAITLLPSPSVDLGDDMTFSIGDTLELNAGDGFSTYQWSTGETTSIIFVTQNGTYSITVTDNNSCTATDEIVVTFTVGSKDLSNNALKADFFPNPTSGTLNILIEKPDASFEEVEFSIFDMFRQVVLRQRQMLQASKSLHSLDLTLLPSGSYAVQIKIGSGIVNRVVQRH